MTRLIRRHWRSLVAILAIGAVVFFFYAQWLRHQQLRRQLEARATELREEVRKLEAVAHNLEAFKNDVMQVEERLEALTGQNGLLPQGLGDQRVEDEVRAIARGSGVRVEGIDMKRHTYDDHFEQIVTLAIEASREAVERFALRIVGQDKAFQGAAHFVHGVDDIFLPGLRGTMRLRTFSSRFRPPAEQREDGASSVAVPDPYPGWLFSLAREREGVRVAERRMGQLFNVKLEVNRFERNKRTVRYYEHLLDKLRAAPVPPLETEIRPRRVRIAELQVQEFVTRGQARVARVAGPYGSSVEIITGDILADGLVKSVEKDSVIIEGSLPVPGRRPLKRLLRFTLPQPPPAITPGHDTTRITGLLLPDGRPDYASWLNQKFGAGVTEPNNARPALDAALAGFVAPGQSFWDYLAYLGEPPNQWWANAIVTTKPWVDQECVDCVRRLERNDKPLSAVTEAVQREHYFRAFPSGARPSAVAIPSLPSYKIAADALAGRGMLRLGRGDLTGAIQDAVTIQRLAMLVGQGPTLVESLTGMAVRQIGVPLLPRIAAAPALARDDAIGLRRGLVQMPRMRSVTEILDSQERMAALDRVLLVRDGVAQGRVGALVQVLEPEMSRAEAVGRVAPEVYLLPAATVDWDEVLRDANRHVDLTLAVLRASAPIERQRAVAAADAETKRLESESAAVLRALRGSQGGTERSTSELAAAAARIAETPAGRRRLASLWAPPDSLARAGIATTEAQALFHLGVFAVDLAVYRLRTNAFPTTLDDLTRDTLEPYLSPEPALLNGYLSPSRGLPGYVLRYQAIPRQTNTTPASYAITAVPEESTVTGQRGFCVDSTGALRFTPDGARPNITAGVCDPALALLR